MTNREKYAEQILDIVCNGGSVAVDLEKQKQQILFYVKVIKASFIISIQRSISYQRN